MALTRISEKRIAANRRNAQKSTGPRTPEGKARSAQNGCIHYAYARHHFLPQSWDRELCEEAKTFTQATTDPVRRAYELDLVYHILWAFRLFDQETQLRSNCLKRFPGDPKRAAHLLVFDPCAQAFMRHLRSVERKLAAATKRFQLYLTPPVARKSRNRSAQAQTSAQRFNLMDLIACLDEICRPKPKRQQNKRPSAPATPTAAPEQSRPSAAPAPIQPRPFPINHRTPPRRRRSICRYAIRKRLTARTRIRGRPNSSTDSGREGDKILACLRL